MADEKNLEPVADWKIAELIRRQKEFEKNPSSGMTWEQVKAAAEATHHLLSIPGMRESIRDGMAESRDEASPDPGW
jgi:hypothetical protein